MTSLPSVLASLAACGPGLKLADHLVVIAHGNSAKQLCDSLHRFCWLDAQASPEGKKEERLDWRKLEAAALAVGEGIGTFTIDLDLMFIQNPFGLLQQPELRHLDYFVRSEFGNATLSHEDGLVNIGFQYFAPTSASRELLEIYLRDQSAWAQAVMQDLLRKRTVEKLQWQVLDSIQAKSFCHLVPEIARQMQTNKVVAAVVKYFLEKDVEWDKVVFYHFPCCDQVDKPNKLCKSLLTNVVLDGWLQSQEL
ncbi:hypothetical protein WJX74_006392 [Apatococcus lobatus]|uniref:Nucleotide-diphospho-sugar transferase domain-containing protein n=1 Tax=Apatococcus lobatus TaxID=904363 RepID=A0AAW1SFG0_9CHLO